MKTRKSGMPPGDVWDRFFNPADALVQLGLRPGHREVADLGCGYGTFAVAAARVARGPIYALDVDPLMLTETKRRAAEAGLENVQTIKRDFVAEGTGLPDGSVDGVMLFNILHAEERDLLLREAYRVARPGGLLAVMHWRHDPTTPRGPSMSIRPRPEQCVAWCRAAGFTVADNAVVDLPPYHYGFTAVRPS